MNTPRSCSRVLLIAAVVAVVCWIWTTVVRRMNMMLDEAVAAEASDSALLDWGGFIFVTVITTGIVAAGGWGAFHAVRQLLLWPKVTAKILRYSISRSEGEPDGQRFFHPVFRFTTTDGRQITTISSTGSWRRLWPADRAVQVRYSPTNPQWAEISCFTHLWTLPLTSLILVSAITYFMWWDLMCRVTGFGG
jgi:hypothetical protein